MPDRMLIKGKLVEPETGKETRNREGNQKIRDSNQKTEIGSKKPHNFIPPV
jgi:hypothetical protein